MKRIEDLPGVNILWRFLTLLLRVNVGCFTHLSDVGVGKAVTEFLVSYCQQNLSYISVLL